MMIFCYLISLFIFGYIYFISNILYHYNSFIYIHIFCQTLWVCNLLYLYAKWRCCTFVILKLFLIQLVMFLNHYEKANKREFHYLLWQWYSTTFNSTTNHSYHLTTYHFLTNAQCHQNHCTTTPKCICISDSAQVVEFLVNMK